MKKIFEHLFAISCILLLPSGMMAQTDATPLISKQVVKQKVIDEGGTGFLKAVAVKDAGLPDFVIYRPKDINFASVLNGKLPLLMFCNGGCSDSSLGYERMLIEIASQGYVVVALGELQEERGDRPEGHTPSSDLKRGLDWILEQSEIKGSDYYQNIDPERVAAAGHSCGGAQVMANAADPRIKTCLMLNSGMGDMEMADADVESLKMLHGPILYITGGPSDVAYPNAGLDYQRISHVPVAYADHPASGHGGTYGEQGGGEYGRIILDWLDWQLKGKKENARIFLGGDLKNYDGWSIKAKNFKHRPGRTLMTKMPCKLLSGITERDYAIYLPGSYEEEPLHQYPVLYLMHGGGGSHTDWERANRLSHVADSLIDCGAIDDMIIVCPEGNQQNMIYFNSPTEKSASLGAPDWKYEDYLFEELIPYIEQNYRARTDRGGRAVAGFSMGGGAATVYGVHRPDMFCMVYDISGYQRAQPLEFLKFDPSGPWRQQIVDDNNPIIRISQGTADEVKAWKQVDWKVAVGDKDFTLDANMDLVQAMHAKGIPVAMHVDDGDHNMEWVTPAMIDAIKRADRNFESLWIKNGDRNIFGIISKPRYTGERQPIAIVSHGFNANYHTGRPYFETLNALGYQVYTFDFPGGSISSRSDNNTMNMSVLDEVNDVKAIVRFFQQQPDVDPSRIVLIGESQGGLVSSLAAADMPSDIRAAILVFPAFCIPADWNKRYPDVAQIPDTTKMWNVSLGRSFFMELRDLDVFKPMKKFKNPVLIVQGDKDPVVKMADSERALKTYRNARLHVIPGAGHGFNAVEMKESLEQIKAFLEEMK
ncbi:MAG: alpha/beta fold hydrolase [Bacteroidales bacterium]|nr:alpha/beta fold hydrolase [Bacteroidales bacterium]